MLLYPPLLVALLVVLLHTDTVPLDALASSSCSRAYVKVVQLVAQVVDLALDKAGMQGNFVEVLASVVA